MTASKQNDELCEDLRQRLADALRQFAIAHPEADGAVIAAVMSRGLCDIARDAGMAREDFLQTMGGDWDDWAAEARRNAH